MLPSLFIVEDEALIAEDIQELCVLKGYKILGIAYNAGQALVGIKDKKPDLILLDINLNDDIDGIEIAQFLEKEINIPYLFITSYTDNLTLERVKGMQFQGYIVKPFSKQQLYTTLELAWSKVATKASSKIDEIEKKYSIKLTTRESEIINLILQGLPLADIANNLELSSNTVKYHIKNIYLKLDIHSKGELFAKLK